MSRSMVTVKHVPNVAWLSVSSIPRQPENARLTKCSYIHQKSQRDGGVREGTIKGRCHVTVQTVLVPGNGILRRKNRCTYGVDREKQVGHGNQLYCISMSAGKEEEYADHCLEERVAVLHVSGGSDDLRK
jgi:hypothetical protein